MDAFDGIISTNFLTADDEPDDEPTIYGLRVLYYHPTDPDRRITALIPWLSYSLPTAERMRHQIASRGELMQTALRRSHHVDDIPWVPMGVKVVTLAEIPF